MLDNRIFRTGFPILLGMLLVGVPACAAPPPTSTFLPITTEPHIEHLGYPIDILYVREIPQTPSPGGPLVEVALRNSSREPIVSLYVAFKGYGTEFPYDFRVSAENPMLPDQTIRVSRILNGVSGYWSKYALEIGAILSDGRAYGLEMIS
jgi:hypothetical protein